MPRVPTCDPRGVPPLRGDAPGTHHGAWRKWLELDSRRRRALGWPAEARRRCSGGPATVGVEVGSRDRTNRRSALLSGLNHADRAKGVHEISALCP